MEGGVPVILDIYFVIIFFYPFWGCFLSSSAVSHTLITHKGSKDLWLDVRQTS